MRLFKLKFPTGVHTLHLNNILFPLLTYKLVPFFFFQLGYGSKGNKIHYSGPLLVPSARVDQILKDHDRHIQEAARRARLDKAKARNAQVEKNQISTSSLVVSGR